jgi:glycosyltransferase involved in cell wall biosynthesis
MPKCESVLSQKVSIIIPSHEDGHFLIGLLDSISAHLNIEYEAIIVVNNCTDNSAEIGDNAGCKVITTAEKLYPSQARNLGAMHASNQLLVFLDADVVITAEWARELSRLTQRSDSFFTGETYLISTQPSYIEMYWFEPLRAKSKGYINGGNIVISRTLFDLLGGFDEMLETGEDVEFSHRAKNSTNNFEFNHNLKVHHEGFPKKLGQFIKRERWHGRGDLISTGLFLKSKIAILSSFFLISHLALFIGIVFGYAPTVILASAIITVICVGSSIWNFWYVGVSQIVRGCSIYYIYFLGRGLSIVDRFVSMVDKKKLNN